MPHGRTVVYSLMLSVLVLAQFAGTVLAGAGEGDVPRGHQKITGVVTQRGGGLVVTTPAGATHQLNANQSRRHGHAPFKAGDEVVAVLDENNYIVDMHLIGEEGSHQLITDELVHLGKTKKEIKLQTPQGERVFPLAEIGLKTKDLPNGSVGDHRSQ